MFRLADPILNAAPSAVVESTRAIVTQNTTVRVYSDSTLQNLKVHKNTTEYNAGATFSVVTGDELWITGLASNLYSTATFVNLLLEKIGFMSFAVVTAKDPATLVIDPAYINQPLGGYLSGYTPVNPNNQLVRVYTASDSAAITNIFDCPSPIPGTIGDGQPYVFVADYVMDKVHKINPSSGIVVQSIDVNKPFGLGYTPTETTVEGVVAYTIVTSPVNSLVHVFNGVTHELIQSVATGAGPYGVCGEPAGAEGDYSFWVACFNANRVEHWYYANGTSLVKDFSYELPVGSGPYDIKVDSTGTAYVSCLISDKVARCPAGGSGVVEYANVGVDPWGLCIKDGYVYAACAGSNAVYAVNTSTLVATPMPSLNGVSFVEIAGSKLYAGSFSSGEFKSYSLATPTTMTGLQDITESERLLEGLIKSEDGTLVFAVNMHNDAPDRTAFPDNTPDYFVLNPLVGLHVNTPVESNLLIISGVLTTSRLVLPSLSVSPIAPVIEKNETAAGTSTLIVNSDTINLSMTTPSDQMLIPRMQIPLVYDGGVAMWVLSMLPRMAKVRIGGWIQGG
jgi:hypothetical protein